MSYEKIEWPVRQWEPHWTGELFLTRFGGSTPFSDSPNYIRSVAAGRPSTPAVGIALPRGFEFTNACEAVGLSDHVLQSTLNLYLGNYKRLAEGYYDTVTPHLFSLDDFKGPESIHLVVGSLWEYLSLSEHAEREKAKASGKVTQKSVSA